MVGTPTRVARREIESLDLIRLRDVFEQLMQTGTRDSVLDVVLGLLTKCKGVIEEQAFEIAALEKQLFGRKSEKCTDAQLSLFSQMLRAVVASAEPAPLESLETSSTAASSPATDGTKPGGPPKKRKQPIPTMTQVIPVADEERPCPTCAGDRHCIGHARSLVIEYTPPKLDVIEYQREKLACRRCDGEIAIAPTPDGKLERSRPGPRLLATLAINKVVDGLPLHRTRRAFGRLGVQIPVQTLNRWEDRAYELAEPVAKRIASLVQCADLINLDDTSLRVRDPAIRGETRHGHIWVFAARKFDPGGDLRKTAVFIYYLYAPTWEAKYPQKFLLNSTAILQGDAYAGYGSIAAPRAAAPKNILVGCMMHARRGFFEAMQAGDPAAFFFIERFQRIYEIEGEAKTAQLTASARLELRRERSLPLLQEMRNRLDDIRGVPAIKPMRDAARYLRNQWPKLLYPFEHDGRLEIDNGEAERRLRRVASGRKAWLFAGSERGAARFAGMLSLVATAEANDVEPGGYLADVFGKLSGNWPNRRLDELLPDRWKLLQQGAE